MRRCVSRHVMSAVAAEAVGPPRILPAVTTQVGRKALQDSYNQNGFAIPKFSLPGDQIAALTRSLEKIQQENPKMEPEKIINAHLYNMGEGQANPFLELGRDPALLDIVAAALNTENVILWAGQIFCKPPGTGRTVPWHQDGQYWPIVPLRAVTAWVALDKSIRSNGCLQVLPGSHTKLHPHVQKLAADAAIDFILDEALFASGQLNEEDACFLELEAGQVEVHHSNIVHRSAFNTSTFRRAGIALAYMPAECLFSRQEKTAGEELGGLKVDYHKRPLLLVRGENTNPENTLVIDARPGVSAATVQAALG